MNRLLLGMTKRKTPEPVPARVADSPLKFENFGIDPEKHGEFKEAMLQAAHAAVKEYPALLETIKGTLGRISPPQALAAFCCYGSSGFVSNNGQQTEALPGILQHHCELLHAHVLSLPPNEWGDEPITPDNMQVLFDTMPKLSDTFFMQRILDGESKSSNEQELTALSLQERIRMHTHTVRNWGYYEQVVQTSRELYWPLDEKLVAAHGFSATDLIDTLSVLQREFEERVAAHMDLLGKVLRGKTAAGLVERYYKLVPNLVGSAEEMLAGLPTDLTCEQMSGMLMAHLDLRLLDTALFTLEGVANSAGKPEEVVSAILGTLSFEPGALEETKPEFLFLDNPVWEKPVISLGDHFLVPLPQAAFSHIHRIMERLAREAGLAKALEERRSGFLEQKLEDVFRDALPDADIYPSFKWKKDGQQFENDLVVVIDRVVVIAEAKSHHLTASGLRGAPDRVKRHVRDLVLSPSIQSHRLEELINAARGGDEDAASLLSKNGIDAQKADRVIRLSVSLYDLSVLSSSEQDFKKIGWVPSDHLVAPSILISDLHCVSEILDNPILFLHYLGERAYVQKSFNLLGDELDFLGLYLDSAFNLSALVGEADTFAVTGMSSTIDVYHEAISAGIRRPKPKMNLRPLFRDIVARLAKVKQPGWTLLGFHLLACADPAEQRAIERSLMKLRRFVQKNYRDPKHTSTMLIKPPETRKATIMFYLFPQKLRGEHRKIMAQLATEAIEADNLTQCVVFGRCTEDWGKAFESALLISQG
ncbi:hypothetical protein HRQ87_16195 [Sulfitobacter sp. 1151]|uniref:NERD domain-containing protein n=2 Tax=Parasulfitobacter algicola TaxID=2614809 RepID=A0ABX2IYS4_9RHOB|nr:hypothetical protein [Sulfitobacter algicola]